MSDETWLPGATDSEGRPPEERSESDKAFGEALSEAFRAKRGEKAFTVDHSSLAGPSPREREEEARLRAQARG